MRSAPEKQPDDLGGRRLDGHFDDGDRYEMAKLGLSIDDTKRYFEQADGDPSEVPISPKERLSAKERFVDIPGPRSDAEKRDALFTNILRARELLVDEKVQRSFKQLELSLVDLEDELRAFVALSTKFPDLLDLREKDRFPFRTRTTDGRTYRIDFLNRHFSGKAELVIEEETADGLVVYDVVRDELVKRA